MNRTLLINDAFYQLSPVAEQPTDVEVAVESHGPEDAMIHITAPEHGSVSLDLDAFRALVGFVVRERVFAGDDRYRSSASV